MSDIMHNTLPACRAAADTLAAATPEKIDNALIAVADAVEAAADEIITANAADCEAMDSSASSCGRLRLDRSRIADIVSAIRQIAALPSPVGVELASAKRPNGMLIRRISVPFGIIGVIFEDRPDVAFDAFALCFKAGSACVLNPEHEATHTVEKAVEVIRRGLLAQGFAPGCIAMLDGGHDATLELLRARGAVDLLIPRGSRRLIDFVRDNARVPVIETGAGVCHTFFHAAGDIATGRDIIYNAKTRRVDACNALDCLLVDRSRLTDLPALCYRLSEKNVTIYADNEAFHALEGAYPLLEKATEEHYEHEWLDYKLTVRVVDGIDEAIEHIARHGSHHSECIITENRPAAEQFLRRVDAACVYSNVSTAFTDGAQFGFGAEMGISTQKLHARGPIGLSGLCTYKFLVTGAGQTRP